MPNGNREVLQGAADSAAASGTPGSYAHSIGWVNFAMNKLGVGLSSRQEANMRSSMNAVDAGQMTNAQASAREGRYFLSDALNPGLSRTDRAGALTGVVANMLFGPAYHAQTDQNNYHMGKGQSKEVRTMMHAHTASDPFS